MTFRKALPGDVDSIEAIYQETHDQEEAGRAVIGWNRKIYPTRQTAQGGIDRGDMYVLLENGEILGCAIINQQQVDVYEGARWSVDAPPEKVLVLHTLVISPRAGRRGYGKAFVQFYESEARRRGCPYLRMDTNAKNKAARSLYGSLGYGEADIVPCTFQGLTGVDLVLLEKTLKEDEGR